MKYIDVHCHLGSSVDGGKLSYDDLKQIVSDYPAEYVVVLPLDEAEKGGTYEKLNDEIKKTADADDRLLWLGRINPHAGDRAVAEVERVIEAGASGIKLHPYSEDFGPGDAVNVFRKIGELDVPVLLHSTHSVFTTEIDGWRRLFDSTGAPVIVAHGGKDGYRQLAGIADMHPNLFVDTTAVSTFRANYVYEAFGGDRIVYGSDLPYSHPGVERVKYDLILKPEDREKVFYYNAAGIFGLA
ncbi:MAG TPA: amidohydrolase family protein [bacterium]|nr:amidohydrolase family protein [bacterium]